MQFNVFLLVLHATGWQQDGL